MTDRKRTLLDVGRDLFITHGYTATSIDEICEGAGVTKGGFFHYFSTKEEFAKALLTDTWQGFLEAHEETDQLPAREALHAHIDFMVGFISSSGRLIPLLGQELGQSNPDVSTQVRGYFKAWTDQLLKALERAGGDIETSSVMEFVIAAIEGTPLVSGQLGQQVIQNTANHLKRYLDSLISDT